MSNQRRQIVTEACLHPPCLGYARHRQSRDQAAVVRHTRDLDHAESTLYRRFPVVSPIYKRYLFCQRGFNIRTSAVAFEVNYVAENHENLQHVLVFFTVTGATPGIDIEAEVLPPFPESHSEGGDRLIIRSGPRNSLPLMLPARILPGMQEVRVQSGHYEIKLITVPSTRVANEDPPPLLDAAQLSSANPTSFICASCSLPLVQATKIVEYRDLPSEHWEELVDAWMCHADQKLHEQVVKHGQGVWPQRGQALVGGSYILFEESSLTQNNLHLTEESKVRFILFSFFFYFSIRTTKKTGVGTYQRPFASCLILFMLVFVDYLKPEMVSGGCCATYDMWTSVKAAVLRLIQSVPDQ